MGSLRRREGRLLGLFGRVGFVFSSHRQSLMAHWSCANGFSLSRMNKQKAGQKFSGTDGPDFAAGERARHE
jgi:hypothetical protein